MATGEKSPSGLIFEALCLRARSTTKVAKTMTRQELQDATGPSSGSSDGCVEGGMWSAV